MNMQQIQAFLAICNLKSFTKASERLYTSQPVISRQVSSLENELGFKLFVRDKKGDISLTAQGEMYAEFMEKFQIDYGEMLNAISTIKARAPRLHIGLGAERTPDNAMSEAVRLMWEKHGFETVAITFLSLTQMLDALYDDVIDIACTDKRVVINCSKDLDMMLVRTAKVKLLLSEKHPLANKEELSIDDFTDETFIRLNSWMPLQTVPYPMGAADKRSAPKRKRVRRGKTLVAPDGSTLLFWCRANIGVAEFLMWNDADFNIENCVLRDVSELGCENEVLAWRKDSRNPLVWEFIERFETYKSS
jgi:DNA-binding transcriptional LysR family regulator